MSDPAVNPHGPVCRGPMLVLVAALFSCFAVCAAAAAEGLKPLTLILQWAPQSQFAGYYVALDKGIYAKHGLDVTILRGGPDREQVDYLLDGRAQFATRWLTTALEDVDRGAPLKHVAQIINRSNLALVGWRDRGITGVEDLEGRRVGIWEGQFRPPFIAFFRARGIHPHIIPQNYSINLFLRGGVEACSAMIYNEYHMIFQAGVDEEELVLFPLATDEMPLPEDGIYCLRETFEADPSVSQALAEASIEGWRYAAEHPEEALDIVMKYVREAHVPTNRAHMRWMLEKILPTIFPARDGLWEPGRLCPNAYRKTADMMIEQGLIREAPAFEAFTVQEGLHVP
jgi:NitT/TauT family transport system substrate-binding protein